MIYNIGSRYLHSVHFHLYYSEDSRLATLRRRNPIASELLTSILTPIAAGKPFGDNVKYDTEFESVKTEMGKTGAIDWEVVETACLNISRSKSKDLVVLCYLSFVYLRQDKLESWVDILDGISQLAAIDFKAFFPDRDRGRQLAIKWLSEPRYTDTLSGKKPAENDYPHLQRLAGALATLKPILTTEFPDGSPFPAAIESFAQKWAAALKPKPKAESPAAGGAVAQPSTAAAAAPAEPMDTPKQAQLIARKAALFLIEKEPVKPMGYRLSRALRWDLLDKAPPAQNGRTQLPGPTPEQRLYFQNLVAKADWPVALAAVEKAFVAAANHLWFDLQRIAAQTCIGLGPTYAPVKAAICFETAMLLQRIPELPALLFADGAPLCDAATKDWITAEVASVFSSGDAPKESVSQATNPLESEKREINALVAAGKNDAAITLVQSAIRQSGNEHDNFRRVLMLAGLLIAAKRPDIAVSMLESLDEKVEMYHLDRWDPDLAVEAWTQMIRAYRVIAPTKPQNIQNVLFEKQNSILNKLSRTNPMSAFQMNL
jgi:type VI secretion system protein VasJ